MHNMIFTLPNTFFVLAIFFLVACSSSNLEIYSDGDTDVDFTEQDEADTESVEIYDLDNESIEEIADEDFNADGDDDRTPDGDGSELDDIESDSFEPDRDVELSDLDGLEETDVEADTIDGDGESEPEYADEEDEVAEIEEESLLSGSGASCLDPYVLPIHNVWLSDSTLSAENNANAGCTVNYSEGPDKVYTFELQQQTWVSFDMSGYDTVLHLRSVCDDPDSELACNDDVDLHGGNRASRISVVLDPGQYFVFADSFEEPGGAYDFKVTFRSSPCLDNPCPESFTCVNSRDWLERQCACPEGSMPQGDLCIDDPCEPNPCQGEEANLCEVDLPDSYHCICPFGRQQNDSGGCDIVPRLWTIMIYLNGDNDLERHAYGDLEEMIEIGPGDDVNVVVLLDSLNRDEGDARRLFVTPGEAQQIDNLGEVDMGDWHTLADFGSWTIENFPAEHYGLVIWDHGNGWSRRRIASDTGNESSVKSFSNDWNGNGDGISVALGELGFALETITNDLGAPIDMIGFDACLMGMWEVAAAAAPYGKVLVASQETEPVDGWEYDGFLPSLIMDPSMTAENMAELIIDSYHASDADNSTLALIDLEQIGELSMAIDSLAATLLLDTESFTNIETIRRSTFAFSEEDELRDLGHFLTKVSSNTEIPQNIRDTALAAYQVYQEVVLYNRVQEDYSEATGLTIYFPSRTSRIERGYADGLGAVWSIETKWDDFLKAYTDHSTQ